MKLEIKFCIKILTMNLPIRDLQCSFIHFITDYAEIIKYLESIPTKAELIKSCVEIIKSNSDPKFSFLDSTVFNFPNLEEVDLIIRIESPSDTPIYAHPKLKRFRLLSNFDRFLKPEDLEKFCAGTFQLGSEEYTKNVDLSQCHIQFFTFNPNNLSELIETINNEERKVIIKLKIDEEAKSYKTVLLEIMGLTVRNRGYNGTLVNFWPIIKKFGSGKELITEEHYALPENLNIDRITKIINLDSSYDPRYENVANYEISYDCESIAEVILEQDTIGATQNLNFEFSTRLENPDKIIHIIFLAFDWVSEILTEDDITRDLGWTEMNFPLSVAAFEKLAKVFSNLRYFRLYLNEDDETPNLEELLITSDNRPIEIVCHPKIDLAKFSSNEKIKFKRFTLVPPLPDIEQIETTFVNHF